MKKQNVGLYKKLIVIALLAGIFTITPVLSSLTDTAVIGSTGTISYTVEITAKSGYWRDIQSAVDQAALAGGGTVHLPMGVWDFVAVGESWSGAKVMVPAGVNIFGAPTERYANGSVIEWKTILQIPYEAAPPRPSSVLMFRFIGDGSANKPSRFSDIKVVGYREFNNTSDRWYDVVEMYNIINFRVDHCFFKNTAGLAVSVRAPANGDCSGVIDHCKFINDYGYVEWNYAECTVHYAIMIRAAGSTRWEEDITKVVGQYTPYTVFIEDCYFSRWRHCVSSNDGVHYVFRYNTIEKDSVVGSLDGHGTYDYVGTRAMEFYENTIIDPVLNKHPENWDSTTPADGTDAYTVNWRGGGGVFFNNYVRNYRIGLYLVDEGTVEKCFPHDIWIWGNTWINVPTPLQKYSDYRPGGAQENIDYFLYAPAWYTPYPYPHPLALETRP